MRIRLSQHLKAPGTHEATVLDMQHGTALAWRLNACPTHLRVARSTMNSSPLTRPVTLTEASLLSSFTRSEAVSTRPPPCPAQPKVNESRKGSPSCLPPLDLASDVSWLAQELRCPHRQCSSPGIFLDGAAYEVMVCKAQGSRPSLHRRVWKGVGRATLLGLLGQWFRTLQRIGA